MLDKESFLVALNEVGASEDDCLSGYFDWYTLPCRKDQWLPWQDYYDGKRIKLEDSNIDELSGEIELGDVYKKIYRLQTKVIELENAVKYLVTKSENKKVKPKGLKGL